MSNVRRLMEDHYIDLTLGLMLELGIEIRDTYEPNNNRDDQHTNGRRGGPRLFSIVWEQTDAFPRAEPAQAYAIAGFKSIAYDSYKILIPERFRDSGRDDQIVHECVHFLQHSTNEAEGDYIQFAESNYLQYVSQRSELEAHLVQVHYLFKHCDTYRQSVIPEDVQATIKAHLDAYMKTKSPSAALQAILAAKSATLI